MPQLPAITGTEIIQRLINFVAAIAAIVVVGRTALLDVPQVFPGGAKIGTVAYDLGLAYLGAWIFNYLVIVLPRRSARQLIYRRCNPLIAKYAASAQAFLAPMFEKANETLEPHRPDAAALRRVCSSINPNDDAPRLINGMPGNWIHWLGLLDYEIRRADVPRRSLESFFPYLEAEGISLITDISEHKLTRVQILSDLGGKIGNTDFLWLEDDLFDYWEACTRLEVYRIKSIQPYT
jgi:hypothetical protein